MKLLPPILLVDDNADDRELALLVLTGAFVGTEVVPVSDAGVLTRALASRRFGLVITEYKLDWIDGAEVVRVARELRPECGVVLFTRDRSPEIAEEAIRLGVDAFVPKSSSGYSRLPYAVRSALYQSRRRAMAGADEAPYRRVFEFIPVGVFVATIEGEVLEANPALASIFGFDTPEELTRRFLHHYFVSPTAADLWRAGLQSGGEIDLDVELRRVDDTNVPVRIRGMFLKHEGGVRQLVGVVEHDGSGGVTQEVLDRRSVELEQSHQELEQMVYVVSHDLQQPLNVVARFLDLLSERDREALSDDGRSYLDHAISSAGTLQRMVDAVLRYSRIGSDDARLERVDLNLVRDKVLALLEEEISDSGTAVTSDDLPTVLADGAQMEQIFHNLLSNAIKFRGEAAPRIRITAVQTPAGWELAVSDNGIGVDPAASERIFLMFQRLHTQEEYPGTGIGLAVCKRIVNQHGGRIWVESQPGEGSTFRIQLPTPFPTSEGVAQ